jgi:excisionase family DNA binding protein
MPRRLLTAAEAAEYLGLSEQSVRQRAYRRQLPFVRVGRNLRFDLRQLDQYIDENTVDEVDQ